MKRESWTEWWPCGVDHVWCLSSSITGPDCSLNIFRSGMNTPNVYVKPKRDPYIKNPVQQKIQHFKRFIENYRRHIVCFIIVYGISAGVALERCYRECLTPHTLLLLPMCSNTTLKTHVTVWPLVQTMVCRLSLQASLRPPWSVWSSLAAQLLPSPSSFLSCSSPCVVTSSRCAERPSSTDTFPLMLPSTSIAAWLWLPSSCRVRLLTQEKVQQWLSSFLISFILVKYFRYYS